MCVFFNPLSPDGKVNNLYDKTKSYDIFGREILTINRLDGSISKVAIDENLKGVLDKYHLKEDSLGEIADFFDKIKLKEYLLEYHPAESFDFSMHFDTLQEFLQRISETHSDVTDIISNDAITLLNLSYISPVKANDEKNVPNLLLFYGPSGLGKTAIGYAIAEDAGTKFKNKTIGMGDEKKTLEWIKKTLEQGEETYRTTGRFSIVQLNEFDDFLNDKPELLKEFLQLINDCSQKYHTTIFITTNNPMDINKKVLDYVDFKIPMGVASKNDIREIVKYYVNNRDIDNYNLDEITNEFESVKPDFMYSNAQIENIIDKKLPKSNCTQNDFINTIRAVKPCITKDINDKFINEQKTLERN